MLTIGLDTLGRLVRRIAINKNGYCPCRTNYGDPACYTCMNNGYKDCNPIPAPSFTPQQAPKIVKQIVQRIQRIRCTGDSCILLKVDGSTYSTTCFTHLNQMKDITWLETGNAEIMEWVVPKAIYPGQYSEVHCEYHERFI